MKRPLTTTVPLQAPHPFRRPCDRARYRSPQPSGRRPTRRWRFDSRPVGPRGCPYRTVVFRTRLSHICFSATYHFYGGRNNRRLTGIGFVYGSDIIVRFVGTRKGFGDGVFPRIVVYLDRYIVVTFLGNSTGIPHEAPCIVMRGIPRDR